MSAGLEGPITPRPCFGALRRPGCCSRSAVRGPSRAAGALLLSAPDGALPRGPRSLTSSGTTSRARVWAWYPDWHSGSMAPPTPAHWRRPGTWDSRFSGPASPISLEPVSLEPDSLAPDSLAPVSLPVVPLPAGPGGGVGAGSTVGVAASGVDVIYPRQHGALWREVARLGAIMSETPPGVQAKSWRFPARNRLIAGLAQMVVVVECHASGGSWHTVEAALRQGLEVGAVPGSVHSSASVGTNTLIHEGATPVRDAQDVLDALGMFETKKLSPALEGSVAWRQGPAGPGSRGPVHAADGPDGQASPSGLSGPGAHPIGPGPPGGYSGYSAAGRSNPGGFSGGAPGWGQRGTGPRPPTAAGRPARRERGARVGAVGDGALSTLDERVRASLNWRPLCLEEIVERSGLPAAAVVVSLDSLEQQGLVTGDGGWWMVAKR